MMGTARHDEPGPDCSRTPTGARKAARCSPDIYGWFTEGFDTADLKEAKALLDELNA
jgi:hypothetical protein